MAYYTSNPQLMARIKTANQAGLYRVAIGLQRAIKGKLNLTASNVGNGGQPSAPGAPPAKNTGTLGRSIQIDQTNPERLLVGTNVVYAKIQEFGGVIRPKRVKALPVPMNLEAKRLSASHPQGLRGIPNLTVIKTRSAVYLVQIVRKGGAKNERYVWGAVWMLKRSVRMPKRPYMAPALSEYRPKASQDYAKGFKAGLGRA